ncbi:MAG: cyclic nucleotide-binding domain-containing protein [Desulfobacterales bacterium]|jgi:uncharacterized protein (TIGR02266 family)|nr:cyclic nucleotide-binding domain-containing protein [Desulfobacteraceae bacterium]MBT7084939.1 cyclic nucleotide-binding domain-containing protein [Desulfobacterales bacterium]MBT7698644.1 cyclic nucleotide-binding domain-containing protein [Desulfobacterales bacterium]
MFKVTSKESYLDGQLVFEEGSVGEAVYVIYSGKVEISKKIGGQKVQIEVLMKGDVFGELGFLTKSSRSATASAIGDLSVGIIDISGITEEFNGLSTGFQFILKSIALRLKKTSENANFGRKSRRVTKSLSITFEDNESLVKAYSGNLSDVGLLIKTPKPFLQGEVFTLKMQLPEDSDPLVIECEVAWSRTEIDDPTLRSTGMGVKFVQISEEDHQRLKEEVEKADKDTELF